MTTRTRFRDCLDDPGPLTGDDAVHAVRIHHACPETCWRGLAAIDVQAEQEQER